MLNRRQFCKSQLAAVTAACFLGNDWARAASSLIDYGAVGQPLTEVAQLDWLCNAVAVTRNNRMFVGLPRWPGYEETPALARVKPDGTLAPFPGGDWNTWRPGRPTANALVNVNTVHIFDDDTLWVVDTGHFDDKRVDADAQKVLQFNSQTGELLRRIQLPESILPPGASLNDLRLDAEHAYFTDSGLGAIIVVNLATGQAMRRLAGHPSTQARPERPPLAEGGRVLQKPNGEIPRTHADPLELSPDGRWLYFQAMTGPLYRVQTALLRDPQVTEAALGKQVHFIYDTPPLSGTCMDSAGNLYFGENDRPRITVLAPDGKLQVLAEDERLWNPDALFINEQRELLIPVPQSARLAFNRGPGGESTVQAPFKVYKVKLPDTLGSRMAVPPVAA